MVTVRMLEVEVLRDAAANNATPNPLPRVTGPLQLFLQAATREMQGPNHP